MRKPLPWILSLVRTWASQALLIFPCKYSALSSRTTVAHISPHSMTPRSPSRATSHRWIICESRTHSFLLPHSKLENNFFNPLGASEDEPRYLLTWFLTYQCLGECFCISKNVLLSARICMKWTMPPEKGYIFGSLHEKEERGASSGASGWYSFLLNNIWM